MNPQEEVTIQALWEQWLAIHAAMKPRIGEACYGISIRAYNPRNQKPTLFSIAMSLMIRNAGKYDAEILNTFGEAVADILQPAEQMYLALWRFTLASTAQTPAAGDSILLIAADYEVFKRGIYWKFQGDENLKPIFTPIYE